MHLFYKRKGGNSGNVSSWNCKKCLGAKQEDALHFIGPEKHTAKSHNMIFEEV